jgi:CRISPR/Cas system-associated endonuclease Cas3-HD
MTNISNGSPPSSLFIASRDIIELQDYRSEAMEALKISGKSDEEIERYIPKTPAERRKYVDDQKNDYKKVKEDVAYLLTQVDAIKEHIGLRNDRNKNNTTGVENLNAASDKLSTGEKLKT